MRLVVVLVLTLCPPFTFAQVRDHTGQLPGPKMPPPLVGPARMDANGDPLPVGAVARIGSARWLHGPNLHTLRFSPTGKHLVSIDNEFVRVWQWPEGRLLCSVDANGSSAYTSARFSPDGRQLAVTGHSVWVVDMPAGQEACVHTSEDQRPVGLAWMPDGKSLVVAWSDNHVRIHDARTGKPTRELGPVSGLGWPTTVSPDGSFLACSGQGIGVHLWSLKTGKRLRFFDDEDIHNCTNDVLAFSPDGKTLAVAGEAVRLYTADQQDPVRTLEGGSYSNLWFSADGKELLAHSGNTSERMRWEVATGKVLEQVTPENEVPRGSILSPDRKHVVTHDGNGRILTLDAATFEESPGQSATGPFAALALSSDGKSTFTVDLAGNVTHWQTELGREVKRVPLADVKKVERVAISSDGKAVVLSGIKDELAQFDAVTGQLIRTLAASSGENVFRFSPDGRHLAELTESGVLRLFDVASGKDLKRFPNEASGDHSVIFSPDGRSVLLLGEDGEMNVLEVTTGQVRCALPNHEGPIAGSFSSNRLLAVLFEDAVSVYRLGDKGRDGKPRARLFRYLPANDFTFGGVLAMSPDGKWLAVATERGFLIWDLDTGEVVAKPEGHLGPVSLLTFTPDSTRLVSLAPSDCGLVWDVAALVRQPDPTATGRKIDEVWKDLTSEGETSFAALRELADRPADAVPFLRKHLPRLPTATPERIKSLLDDLDDPKFANRQKAALELGRLGEAALPAMRKRLAGETSAQARAVMQELVERIGDPLSDVELLRAMRAIEALETMATPEAVRLLQELASDVAEAARTREAKAALARLRR